MNRRQYAIIALVSACILVASAAVLTSRLATFYKQNPTKHWVFQELDARRFTYAKKPVELTDIKDAAGTRYLDVTYGPESLHLRVTIPHRQHDLLVTQGLAAHRDWFRIVRFAEVSGMDADDAVTRMETGEIRDRLAIVTRIPRSGVDPQTWGEAWRKDWSFEFYEFQPEGGFATERLHYPTTKRGQPPKAGELLEGTWQFDAALLTMPKAGAPSQQFLNTGFKAMGWTFPAACLSCVAFTVSIMMAAYKPKQDLITAPPAHA